MAVTLETQMVKLAAQNDEYLGDVCIVGVVVSGLTGGRTTTLTDSAGKIVFSRKSVSGEDVEQSMGEKYSKGIKLTTVIGAGHVQVHIK